MHRSGALCLVLLSVASLSANAGGFGRTLKQANQDPNVGTSVTVTADKPNVDAIAITPVLPYPQTGYFCNVSGDSRLPSAGGVFPLTVRVPVGVAAKVIFANITGTIPGTSSGCASSVVQQGTSVQQPGTSTSVVQQPGTSTSVVQPGTNSTSVVQQPGTSTSVVQQPGTSTSVVQQPGTSTSVVQQPGTSTSVVQQPGTSTSVVQQPGTSTSVVQQPGTSTSVVQPGTNGTTVVQPGTAAAGGNTSTTPLCSTTPTTVVQQPTTVVQQPTSVVQQPGTPGVTSFRVVGRKLSADLKPAPIEFISNNGSTGQPALSVTDTVEGVPNIVFTPTAVGQTASFTGALQEAVTTTHDGYGVPYIPYQIDAKLSPNCGLLVKFIAV